MVPRDSRHFGNYELIAKLATGGMAEIFLARPAGHAHGKLLVLKRILPHLAEDDHFVTMFRDEADLASKLIHPNVGKVHALGHHAGSWFIAMEYLHGVPLSRMMTRLSKQARTLDVRIVTGIIAAACEGLHHAHELRDASGTFLNVVHRDVSPPNIMVVDGGLVKLLDFGIAKAITTNAKTRTGTVKGKNAYMSPEQIMGKPLDRRSDIFALGTVMYEMLTIKRLFHRESDFLTFKAISEEPIPDVMQRRPDLPTGLRSVLLQALARDPAGRFGNAKQFGDAIRGAMMTVGGPASTSELAEFLSQQFGDELASHDEILRAADDPSAIPETSASTASNSAMARAASLPHPAAPLEYRQGELAAGASLSRPTPELSGSIPSMIVSAESARMSAAKMETGPNAAIAGSARGSVPSLAVPEPLLGLAKTAPVAVPYSINSGSTSQPIPSLLSANGASLGNTWAPGIDDDGASLRTSSRRRFLRNAVIALAVLAAAVLLVMVVSRSDKKQVEPPAVGAPDLSNVPDPTPPVKKPDEMSRDDIVAMSRFGFLSIKSPQPRVTLYLNERLIGELPMQRIPVAPGIYKAKAVGARGKLKRFDITIYGGKDTDVGAIDLDAK
jgi:serine/threonine protein kinase